ncbi:hypothetical protein ACSQ67_010077 [Phaseolus vulgaris]
MISIVMKGSWYSNDFNSDEGEVGGGRVVLIRKSVVENLTNVKGLIGIGLKLINSSVEDITKYVSFKLTSRTKSHNH